MLKGCVKIQLGLLYVVEVMAGNDLYQSSDGLDSIGYALFDLQHRQLTQVFCFFEDVMMAAKAMALV